MKVKMLQNAKGSPDGIQVCDYQKNVIYDLNESLANSFIEQGLVELVEEKAADLEYENKAIEGVKENKESKSKRKRKKKEDK